MVRPVVGITSYVEPASWGAWQLDAALIPYMYVQALERAGRDAAARAAESTTGWRRRSTRSTDCSSPAAPTSTRRRTAPRRTRRQRVRPTATAPSWRCSRAALARDMPVLAVCRGVPGAERRARRRHRPAPARGRRPRGASRRPRHLLRASGADRGRLAARRRCWASAAPVKSHHHQGFGRLGDGLREVAWADDGIVEGVEDPSKRFARRRPLAPGGGRGRAALRRARRRGARVPRGARPMTAVLNPATEETIAEVEPHSAEQTDEVLRARRPRSRPGAPSRPPTAPACCAGSRRSSRSTTRSCRASSPATPASRSPARAARSAWSRRSSTSTRARWTSTTARRSPSPAAST